MNNYRLSELPYHADSSILFDKIVDWPWAIFLDSCQPQGEQGRYDIMSAKPYKTLSCVEAKTQAEDPFQQVKKALQEADFKAIPPLPFSGGALGYFGYDLAQSVNLPHSNHRIVSVPDMAIGLYDWGIVVDHQEKNTWCFAQHTVDNIRWQALLTYLGSPPSDNKKHEMPLKLLSPLQSNMTQLAYNTAFKKIKQHIYDGDCYQVNFAQCLSARVQGNAWETYRLIRKINPAPYAAFMRIPNACIASLSPEQFLQVCQNKVQTKPIKGTRKRNQDPKIDMSLAQELLTSQKDRAENLMIVDLLRNDFGKSCVTGSIEVPHLFELESFASVHHLVTTVRGELKPDQHSIDLLRHCFPGGSITGAPKKRAMEIIANLEPQARSLYCGSMGYINCQGDMETNILIRTFIIVKGTFYCYAGGGVVADSTAEDEYQETFIKVSSILSMMSQSS